MNELPEAVAFVVDSPIAGGLISKEEFRTHDPGARNDRIRSAAADAFATVLMLSAMVTTAVLIGAFIGQVLKVLQH